MSGEGNQEVGAGEVLIAEENLGHGADSYVDWLTRYAIDRNDERLRALVVRLRQVPGLKQPQKLYYLPRELFIQITGEDPPAEQVDSRPRRAVFATSEEQMTNWAAAAEASEVSEPSQPELDVMQATAADITAVARWVETVVTPWTRDYRTAARDENRLDQVRMWNRIDGLRRLVETLCSAEDLAWLETSLHRQGIPIDEPTLGSWPEAETAQATDFEDDEDLVIDLRETDTAETHDGDELVEPEPVCTGEDEATEAGRWGIKGPARSKRRRLFY